MAAKKGYTAQDHIAAYEEYGSTRKAAAALGVDHRTIEKSLAATGYKKQKLAGDIGGLKTIKMPAPKGEEVLRYIVTAAQNDTKVNASFWENLKALADYYDAHIYVCPFTYSPKTSLTAVEEPQWAPELQEYIVSDRVQLAQGLVLCAEVTRTLPTAARPLSGYETYTGRASGIFPHAKIAMESIPSMRTEPTKFNYTTGAVTRHHYSRTKAGFKGEFHHAYGALIVEVTNDGWWVRQLNADRANRIYDLDVCAEDGQVFAIERAAAITFGDAHNSDMDPIVREATWGSGGLVDFLRPHEGHYHDIFDMNSRPWQEENDFHRQFEKHVGNVESVQGEVKKTVDVFNEWQYRPWMKHIIVRSNHDEKLEKWLNFGDYKKDLVNAVFFLEAQLAKVKALIGKDRFLVLEWAMRRCGIPAEVTFLEADESHIVCKARGGDGIECGGHGHYGPNGSRGSTRSLAKMARKQNKAHDHTAAIFDGVYSAGTKSVLNPAYAKGPSSWSHSDIVTYENGKRAIVTMWKGRFFAPRP